VGDFWQFKRKIRQKFLALYLDLEYCVFVVSVGKSHLLMQLLGPLERDRVFLSQIKYAQPPTTRASHNNNASLNGSDSPWS
jgi:hypothetical protein